MNKLFVSILVSLIPLYLNAQNDYKNAWKQVGETSVVLSTVQERRTIPKHYAIWETEFLRLRSRLSQTGKHTIEIPYPDGSLQTFQIEPVEVLHPDLAAQFPQIKTFSGRSVRNPAVRVRVDITEAGFHAMARGGGMETVYVDPYAFRDTAHYISYYRKDLVSTMEEAFSCGADLAPETQKPVGQNSATACGSLRVYRLALACTQEYAQYHGGTTSGALSAMTTTMNRVNGIYEDELSIRMVIIPNNNLLVYLNNPDPYNNNNIDQMPGQNQTNIDAVIGSANYDIGHVFGTKGGRSSSGIGSVCQIGEKAKSATGISAPTGDGFSVDYVCHEMGHQFGARHTQFSDCSRNAATAVEPGSGSTIMGYAGSCSPNNIQLNSDAYFHAVSIAEIDLYTQPTNPGGTCPTLVANSNDAPVIAPISDYSIPPGTPFVLTGVASDANGDALEYCWEQVDAYANVDEPMPPAPTSLTGPLFRSYAPESGGTRYFPRFSNVLSGINPTWEELPTVSRNMNFRLTVRDNRDGGGCTSSENVQVSVAPNASAFRVNAPNTFAYYQPGSSLAIEWSVGNTTAFPVSCPNVDILLSTDNGQSFTVLAAATDNDGIQTVQLPTIASFNCRILVRCSNNIFYDVSDVNFSIGYEATICQEYTSTDVPKDIPEQEPPLTPLEFAISQLEVTQAGEITDVDVISMQGHHNYIGDLVFVLRHPDDTRNDLLFDDNCNKDGLINISFDDDAPNPYNQIPCPPNDGQTYEPALALANLNGKPAAGVWELRVFDLASGDTGVITGWGLRICSRYPSLIPFPVELLSFDAVLQGNDAVLRWVTALERNSKTFIVERSEDAFADRWTAVGAVGAAGNSNEEIHYNYTDKGLRPHTTYYYRLRQIDNDDAETFSRIVSLKTNGKTDFFDIAPNPVSDRLQIRLYNLEEERLNIRIFDAAGVLVWSQTTDTAASLSLPVEQLPTGAYSIRVESGREAAVKRFIKM